MKYPKLNDKDFGTKINKMFKKYEIPDKKKSLKEICYPDKYKFQLPQLFLADFMSPSTPYKGLLVYHGIGSGKTCTSIRIAEKWKHKKKIIILVPASLRGNYRGELRGECGKYFYMTKDETEKIKKLDPFDNEYTEIIKKTNERINKYYEIYSYNKFVLEVEKGNIDLNNTLMIVDEIQNMISEDGKFYATLYEAVKNAPDDFRLVLLSATPMFNKPREFGLIMKLLREDFPTGSNFDKKFIKQTIKKNETTFEPKNIDEFKKLINGYVSYYRGAPPYVYPELIIKYVNCEMSEFQYNGYKRVISAEKRKFFYQDIIDLPNEFYLGTRMISNVAFPNQQIGDIGYKSFNKSHILKSLKTYSIKFYKIIKKIKKCHGKVFVYSNFKEYGGIKSFINVLDAYGYKNYENDGPGRKRYAIWSGDTDDIMKDEIKTIYNRDDNIDGNKIKIILGSPSIKEGVSLLAVRQVHIIEPYWNIKRIEQIIGRASRFCSHKKLPEEERNVKVYIYVATHPKEKRTVDEYIKLLAFRKDNLINKFEKIIKETSIDCRLNKNANVYKGDDDIKCT